MDGNLPCEHCKNLSEEITYLKGVLYRFQAKEWKEWDLNKEIEDQKKEIAVLKETIINQASAFRR